MKIEFKISKKRLKWKWLRQAADPNMSTEMMAACMVGPDGEYLEHDAAVAILDDLDMEEIERISKQFGAAVKDWTVPPPTAAS
jgi:hypothetical protein